MGAEKMYISSAYLPRFRSFRDPRKIERSSFGEVIETKFANAPNSNIGTTDELNKVKGRRTAESFKIVLIKTKHQNTDY